MRRCPSCSVVTQPDRPSGRGKRLSAPPVKVVAEGYGIPVYQPARIREREVIEHIRAYGAECAVVVAYGQILPQAFLDAFALGTLNVHASLLPAYRGAAPLQRCLLAGETRTGVTIMLLDAGMDTGPMLSQREVPIGEDTTFGSLHDEMAQAGAELLLETLREWRAGRLVPVPQDDALATYAPPILKTEGRIVWESAARRIVNTIRAFDPSPGAYGFFQGQRLKFFQAALAAVERCRSGRRNCWLWGKGPGGPGWGRSGCCHWRIAAGRAAPPCRSRVSSGASHAGWLFA